MVGVLVFSSPASAAAALTVTPSTGLSNGTVVQVSGSGFADSATGAMLECNNDPGQPTVEVAGIEQAPVGCTNPLLKIVSTSSTGAVPSTSFTVATGTVGPPTTGTDSAGNDAATDAALYPCPPTAAQVSAGDSCVIAFGTEGGSQVTTPISFSSGEGTTTTTTSSSTTTTTTTASTTTTTTTAGSTTTTSTTVPCNAKSTTSTGPPSLTANPGTCLNGGTVVTLTGSGFDDTSPGTVLECNNDASQPTVALPSPVSENVPVSCSSINLSKLVTTSATGTLSTTFTVIAGTTGPSCGAAGDAIATCPSTDSTGGSPAADAAKYPCPPTTAQIAAGASCTLSFGDLGGKQGTVAISFVPAPTPASTTTATTAAAGSGSSTTGAATTAAATTAATPTTGTSSLAFTGAGPDTWYTLLGGLLLLDLGFLILTLYYRPREMAQMLRHGVSRTFGGK